MIVLNWKDKRGYTLVELMISMAVFALVAGAILIFLSAGSRSYTFAKTELDLQMESQTLLSQINTMILEANNAVYDSTTNSLTLYQIETVNEATVTADPLTSTAPVYTETRSIVNRKVIYFDSASSSLYLDEESGAALPVSGTAMTISQDRLMSSYIDSFGVDVDGNRVVVKLGMKNGKRTFNADTTTKMRSRLVPLP